MDDQKIVDLYWERSESAIKETQKKYGRYCHSIAYAILHSNEDAEECVNDTYLRAWGAIPPAKPSRLATFLGKITRNLALDRYGYNKAKKRNGGIEAVIDEYYECIPSGEFSIEDELILKNLINGFLESLDSHTRIIFLQRYWYTCGVQEIAENMGMTENNVSVTLHRTRNKFKAYLEKEGINV